MNNDNFLYIQVLTISFIAVLFTHSGLSKAFDLAGSKAHITSIFDKTFLKGLSPVLFYLIVVLELAVAVLAIIGLFQIHLSGSKEYCVWALKLALLTLLALFSGQRVAKDYVGAAGIVPYAILVIIALIVFA